MGSKPGTLNWGDLVRLAALFGYAFGGFAVTWAIGQAHLITDPTLQMIVMGVLIVVAKALKLTATDTTPQTTITNLVQSDTIQPEAAITAVRAGEQLKP